MGRVAGRRARCSWGKKAVHEFPSGEEDNDCWRDREFAARSRDTSTVYDRIKIRQLARKRISAYSRLSWCCDDAVP